MGKQRQPKDSTDTTPPKVAKSSRKKKQQDVDPAPDPTPSVKTAEKRQLPLDFSRHAVQPHVKKNPALTACATNSTNDHDPLSQPMSTSVEPPVIRVNLTHTAGSLSHTVANNSSTLVAESDVLDEADKDPDLDSTSRDNEIGYEDLYEDEGDDLIRRRPREGQRLERHGDEYENEDVKDESALNRDEASTDPTAAMFIKSESNESESTPLDVLLPTEYKWKTVYVAAFELALDTVLPGESFLFTEEEHIVFEIYRGLPDDAKHLFVRLFLRNQKFWFRLSKLEGRYREILNLESAIRDLVTSGLLMDQACLRDPTEAITMLTMDELKILARRVGIKERLSGRQRQDLVDKILEHFRQQSFLFKRLLLAPGGTPNGEGEGRKSGLASHIFSGDATKRNEALINKMVDISVFYRSREYTEKPALLEAILAKIGQRIFPVYEITRTSSVFKSQEELIKYEEAIKIHYDLADMIESAMGPGKDAVVYVRDPDQAKSIQGNGRRKLTNHAKAVKQGNDETSALQVKGKSLDHNLDDLDAEQLRRLEVIGIYEQVIQMAEGIRGAWREYVALEHELSSSNPSYFLLRFSPGWVYTQILRLELRAFAFLKRFEEESVLLHELLDQQVYSLGQRGGWYDRLALVKSNYSFDKRLGKKEALQVCMMGLRDKYVHTVDATVLQSRIVRLESELRVPFRDRHDFSYLTFRKAQKRILTGERLNTPGTAAPSYASSHAYAYIPNSMGSGHPIAMQRPLWRNIDGSDCGVEELALSYYGTLGYKGFHSENSILSTLFGLLFWDILFSSQPGVFETLYQTEPLDLRTDAFFLTRRDLVMERIEKIAKSVLIEYSEPTLPTPLMRHSIKKEQSSKNRNIVANEQLRNNLLFEDDIEREFEEDDPSEERLLEKAREEQKTKRR
ncbi:hypothetical protein BGW38_002059, partial [Lunasporangiospora selenospora]